MKLPNTPKNIIEIRQTTETLTEQHIDREQIYKFCALLGITQPDDIVYFRAFPPKGFSAKKGDVRMEAIALKDLIPAIVECQRKGWRCYMVVNEGGHHDHQITKCRAIFYEHDDIPIEEQKELWRSLGLSEPSFQIWTGGSSIHSYWLTNCTPEQWKLLQKDLIAYAKSDPKCSNLSRVMAIPGTFHISENGVVRGQIVSESGKVYSYEELRAAVPTTEEPKPEIPEYDDRPEHIHIHHWHELITGSAIAPEIAALNWYSEDSENNLISELASPVASRNNGGRLSSKELWKLRHWGYGALVCKGVRLETGDRSNWGSYKANQPRHDGKGKPIKYEHPAGRPVEAILLAVTPEIWELVARRYGVALPAGYREAAPIEFWRWVLRNINIPVTVTEGAKKAGALLSQGIVAIAIVGIWAGCREVGKAQPGQKKVFELLPEIQQFAVVGRAFDIAFDKDSKNSTVANVIQATNRLAYLLQKQGCGIGILDWVAEAGKGIDDVIVNRGVDYLEEIYKNSKSLQQWKSGHLKLLTKPVSQRVSQRYLNLKIPLKEQCVGIKSPKGTGKTQQYGELAKIGQELGHKILGITHRIQLGKQMAGRLRIPYIEDVLAGKANGDRGYILCVDSLHPNSQAKFNIQDWAGAWIFIDEIVQWIRHLLQSTTCQEDRQAIIKTLTDLLIYVRQTGGRVFFADADLNDIAVDFITSLMGIDRAYLVENSHKSEPYNIHHYLDKNPARMLDDLFKIVETGGSLYVATGGQQESSKWGTRNLEDYILKQCDRLGISRDEVLRIDSMSTKDPTHPAFGCTAFKVETKVIDGVAVTSEINVLNELLPKYRIVVSSPTLETGASYDDRGHFTAVAGIGQGVQECDSFCQSLDRVRENVDRYIWTAQRGMTKVGTGEPNYYILLKNEEKKSAADRKILKRADIDLGECGVEPIHDKTWAKLGAITNANARKYRQVIAEKLISDGHNLIECIPDSEQVEAGKGLSKVIKSNCEELAEQEDKAIAEAVVDDEEFEKLKNKTELTKNQVRKFKKGVVKSKYNVPEEEVTAELIRKDRNGWYSAIRTDYNLTFKSEIFTDAEGSRLENYLSQGTRQDANRRSRLRQIEYLKMARIDELKNADEIYESHPLVVEIASIIKPKIKEFHDYGIEINVSKKITNLDIVRDALSRIGYKLPKIGQRRINGKPTHIYGKPAPNFEYQLDKDGNPTNKIKLDDQGRAIPVWDGRDEIFKRWYERDTQNESFIINQIAKALKKCQSSDDVKSVVTQWREKQHIGEVLTEEQVDFNNKIDRAIGQAWQKIEEHCSTIPADEAMRLRGLRIAGMTTKEIIAVLDKDVLKRPGLTQDYLESLDIKWQWRLEVAEKYGQDVVTQIKNVMPKPATVSQPTHKQLTLKRLPSTEHLSTEELCGGIYGSWGVKIKPKQETSSSEDKDAGVNTVASTVKELLASIKKATNDSEIYIKKMLLSNTFVSATLEIQSKVRALLDNESRQLLADCLI